MNIIIRRAALPVILAALVSCVTFVSPLLAHAASISIWWPTDGATIAGVQPFKALVDGMAIDSYSMYWQVDNGQLNPMPTNTADYPHKEASVDVSSWHWSSTGAYHVNFVAQDSSGNTIVTRQITIYANVPTSPSQTTTAPAPTTTTTAPAPAPTQTTQTTTTSTQTTPPPTTTTTTTTTTTSSPTPLSISESVWWPTNNATITGTQPFKAVMNGMTLSSYTMYWQVDNGQLNLMTDNYSGAPHKEATVDVSGWSWHGTGPYVLTFVAKDLTGTVISTQNVTIYTGTTGSTGTTQPPATVNPTPSPTPTVAPVPAPSPVPAPTQTTTTKAGDPLSGFSFYVDPNSNAANQVKAWSTSNPTGAAEIEKIASEPQAKWLGDWNTNIYNDTKTYVDAAASAGQVPVLISYNIPERDCGGYSSGGATSPSAYETWISGMASAIGTRKAVVILEPDALAMIDCLSSTDAASRYALLNYAVNTLKANPNTVVYLDAGNSNWIGASVMSQRLNNAGLAKANGFSLNVSNFYWTADNVNFGQSVSSLTGGKHFVVDTSRNGLGPYGTEWCNPPGRALGTRPTIATGNALVDAFLWLKAPGESDGTCNGGPSAGVWWSDYALGLAQRAAY